MFDLPGISAKVYSELPLQGSDLYIHPQCVSLALRHPHLPLDCYVGSVDLDEADQHFGSIYGILTETSSKTHDHQPNSKLKTSIIYALFTIPLS